MKLIITESQLGNLVIDLQEAHNFLQRDGYHLTGGWKQEDTEMHEHIYKRMKTIYKALSKGRGTTQVLSDEYPPFDVSYELPPVDVAQFSIAYPRGSWDQRAMQRPDGASMTIYVNAQRIHWTIHNLEEFQNHPMKILHHTDTLVKWLGGDLIKRLILPRFEKFDINIF